MIFSTAPSNHSFASIEAMYNYLPHIESNRSDLNAITDYFISKRKGNNKNWLSSNSQIQSLLVPGNEEVVKLGNQLKETGINALPIRTPSVATGSERIRFCLHAYNTEEEIDLLFEVLSK